MALAVVRSLHTILVTRDGCDVLTTRNAVLKFSEDAEYAALVSLIDKAVKRGALHKNSGARKKSRAARLRARQTA